MADQNKLDESLYEGDASFWLLFRNAAIGIIILDMEGRHVMSNPAFQKMLGYNDLELQQMVFTEFTHPDDVERDRLLYQHLIAGRRDQYTVEKRYIRKDGATVWGNLTVSLVLDSVGRPAHAIGMLEDITERKLLAQQLVQSQRLEAIGQLAGGIAHDFNNLLTVVRGYAQCVQESLGTEHPSWEDVDQIRQAGERAATLTRQLLVFSRKKILEPRALNLNEVVRSLDTLLGRLIGENIVLTMDLEPDLCCVQADRGQIEQVIMNLVINASDAMPNGGKLTIETANVNLDGRYAEKHMGVTPGAYGVVAVSDTGVGIDKKTQARIFEPFFTTKAKGRGTGLGLSTVYGIVKQSAGNVWVYSEPGKGTTLKVYLPQVDAAAEPLSSADMPVTSARGSETVLVVEDDALFREFASRALTDYGYTVLAADHPDAALTLSEQHDAVIHLVLSDVVLPGMTGRELVERLTEARPEMNFLYMSGYPARAVVQQGELPPGTPFIAKPFSANALARKVRHVLENGNRAEA